MSRNGLFQHTRRRSFHLRCHQTEGDQTQTLPPGGSPIVSPHSYHSSPHYEYGVFFKSKEPFVKVTNHNRLSAHVLDQQVLPETYRF